MKTTITADSSTPFVSVDLSAGEVLKIQRGAMLYHSGEVALRGRLNTNGQGGALSRFVKSAIKAVATNEAMFITEVESSADGGVLALAPNTIGAVKKLAIGTEQYRLNDGAFLAMDDGVSLDVERQTVGKALFGGQGGFFIMTTRGQGELLVNAFGSIREIDLNNAHDFAIDNAHVVAWSTSLNYDIHTDGGVFNSFKTGEGLVNTFSGTGKVYVQSLNLSSFVDSIMPLVTANMPSGGSSD